MKNKIYLKTFLLIVFSIISFSSSAQSIEIEGYTSAENIGDYPLFIVNPYEISVSSTSGSFDYVYVDDIQVAYNSSDYWSQYSFNAGNYSDNKAHKLQLKRGSSNYGICYFSTDPNIGININELVFTINEGKAYVSGSVYSEIIEAIIPDTYTFDGNIYSVVGISDNAFRGKSNLKKVVIPNSVTSIGSSAFLNCTNIKSLTIGSSVISIGDYAFSTTTSIGYLYTIPKVIWMCNTPPTGESNVKASQNYVANNEFSLSNKKVYQFLSSIFEVDNVVYVPVSPSERTCDVIDCNYFPSSTEIRIDSTVNNKGIELKVLEVNKYAFYENSYITSLSISNEGNIGNSAFYDCDALKSVVASNNGYIGNFAFYDCDALESVVASNNGYIGESAFYDCDALITVTATNQGNIQEGAFRSCDNLKTIDLTSIGSIGSSAFRACISLETALLNIQGNIGNYAFQDCLKLTSITLGSGIGTIGSYAFSGNKSLQEIDIPNNITQIGSYTFSEDTKLNNVILGEGILSLPERVFNNCSSLPSLVIPANINEIGNYAFAGCSSLSDVTIEENKDSNKLTILKLGSNGSNPLFNDCTLDDVFIGRKLSYKTSSNYGYSPFYRNTSLRTVEITDAETQIYDNEFYGCSNLKSLKIGNGVKTIGNWAFSGCSSLDYFSAGYDVESIGEEAFSDCTALTEYYSYSIIPPVCGNQALDDINKWNCSLYVPSESADEYQAAPQWKDFFFINEMEAVAVTNIILNVENVELRLGDAFQLEATIEPRNASDQTVSWTSSNPSVASVSEKGLISALKEGTTIVTATCGDITATCTVTVLDDAGVVSLLDNPEISISVYSIEGILIKKDCKTEDLKTLTKGIYIIVSGKERYKISI